MLFVPERKSLVPPESRDAAHSLLAEIRSAETARELLIYARHVHADAAEFRNLLNLIESEIITKIEQFAREAEVVPEAPRIGPPKNANGLGGNVDNPHMGTARASRETEIYPGPGL